MDPSKILREAGGPTTVRMRPDGPLVLDGDFVFGIPLAQDPPAEPRAFLCRCGASANKPFCDGTHKKTAFRHDGTFATDTVPGTSAAGRVTVTPLRNGPLECRGPLVVEGSDGRRTAGDETWLCRCGGSQNKPYCDGTHEKNGFTG